MKIIYAASCLDYGQPGHPESPERVRYSYEFLSDRYEFVEPEPATEEDILLVHTQEHINSVKQGRFMDADTPVYSDIYSHALKSAGGALLAMRMVLDGKASFSLMRPPGHHAGRSNVAGFCYFNNIAIASARALESVDRVAIVDFDCHHGDGTENIFRGHDRVLYVSLHQSPLYPGTGLAHEDNCLNFPLGAFTSEAEYLSTFQEALRHVSDFGPDLIAVSAGFDTFKDDPITNLDLDMGSYEQIGRAIKNLGLPIFSILEGGYSPKLPGCIESYLNGIE